MATRLSKVFIGSSKENLDIAYAIQENLDHDADVTVWNQDIFKLSEITITSLLSAIEEFDFAIFVFNPDDVLLMRSKEYTVARDNVIFELGLFMGKLGKANVFYIIPTNSTNLHLPSDLLGMTSGTYRSNREDGNLIAALGPFCNKVRRIIRERFGIIPKNITMEQIFQGTWKNVYTFVDKKGNKLFGSEIVEIYNNNKYYADGSLKFKIEDLKIDRANGIIEFIKINVNNEMIRLPNKLRIISENLFQGTESEVVDIKYEKIE